jgi:hypothetical protein
MLPIRVREGLVVNKQELTIALNSFVNELRASSVHGKHVEVDPTDLGIEVGSY